MSDLTRRLRETVEKDLEPIKQAFGDEHPVVRQSLVILQKAEAIEEEMQAAVVTTERASELTGWSTDTLRDRARDLMDGKQLAGEWAGLKVTKAGHGYGFVLGTIPERAA